MFASKEYSRKNVTARRVAHLLRFLNFFRIGAIAKPFSLSDHIVYVVMYCILLYCTGTFTKHKNIQVREVQRALHTQNQYIEQKYSYSIRVRRYPDAKTSKLHKYTETRIKFAGFALKKILYNVQNTL